MFQTKGLIKEALDLCASRGFYHLSPAIQNMLLDRGYDDIVCTANNGAFISYMKPEEAVKFLLMHVSSFLVRYSQKPRLSSQSPLLVNL